MTNIGYVLLLQMNLDHRWQGDYLVDMPLRVTPQHHKGHTPSYSVSVSFACSGYYMHGIAWLLRMIRQPHASPPFHQSSALLTLSLHSHTRRVLLAMNHEGQEPKAIGPSLPQDVKSVQRSNVSIFSLFCKSSSGQHQWFIFGVFV